MHLHVLNFHKQLQSNCVLQQIYLNTTSLVAHEIVNNFTGRPDLALTYYPSKYEFYWFVSRTYAYLNRFYVRDALAKVDPRLDVVSFRISFRGRTQFGATIVQQTKRHSNGVLLAGRWWPTLRCLLDRWLQRAYTRVLIYFLYICYIH